MALNEELNDRIRLMLNDIPKVEEKKMFRGLCFMVNGKMCICAGNDELMCRINPELYPTLSKKKGVRPMVMKGKVLPGYLNVHKDVVKTEKDLRYWLDLCLEYNKVAKASPKKKKKV